MKSRLLSSIIATGIALVVPHVASAATIVNISTTAGSLTPVDLTAATGPALNLVNASSPYQNNLNSAFIFSEGVIGRLQSFLLHFDDAPGNPQGRVTGSFGIQLAQGETLGAVSQTAAQLIATDRLAGVLYSANGNRGLEANGNGADILSVTLNGLLATINFDLRANQALDNVRFDINRAAVVPEPETWLMMLAGFGLMGAALRRRRGIQVAYS
jgi:PEP-CTERM motif